MKITQLEKQLQSFRKEVGDVPVTFLFKPQGRQLVELECPEFQSGDLDHEGKKRAECELRFLQK